jgi:outer membrane protein assembly factor BamB
MPRRLLWCLSPLPVLVLAWTTGFGGPPAARPLPAPADRFQPGPHDWPQWQGKDRNAVSTEKGLLPDWPRDGPPLAWQAKDLGGGYSTPSVAAGRVFGMGFKGDDEVVWALEEANGKPLWTTRIAAANKHVGYPEGPRCTPTVDGELVYALGLDSDLVCLEAATGKERWRSNLQREFKGSSGGWGYSESPLIDGDKVLCTPGGRDATLLALNKQTGALVWKGVVPDGDGAQYSSIIAATVDGKRQYVQFLGGGVVGLSGEGKFLWRYDHPANGTANCSTPLFHDGRVFAASGYGTGGGLVRIRRDGDKYKAEEVYFTKEMKNHHGGMVLLDGYLYGADEGRLTCLDFNTGKVAWAERKAGKGSIAAADGRLYYRDENGPMLLVEANPAKYVEHGRFEPAPKSGEAAWPHPVLANGRLYLRDQDLLFCYDVKKK